MTKSSPADADFGYWAKQSSWSLKEAAALFIGIDPRSELPFKRVEWGRTSYNDLKEYLCDPKNRNPAAKQYIEILDTLERDAEDHYNTRIFLNNPPTRYIEWAKRKRFHIPHELERAVVNINQETEQLRHHARQDFWVLYEAAAIINGIDDSEIPSGISIVAYMYNPLATNPHPRAQNFMNFCDTAVRTAIEHGYDDSVTECRLSRHTFADFKQTPLWWIQWAKKKGFIVQHELEQAVLEFHSDEDMDQVSPQSANNEAKIPTQPGLVERETLLWIAGVCLHKFKPTGFQDTNNKGNALAGHLIEYAKGQGIEPKVKGTLSKAIQEVRAAVEVIPRIEEILEEAEKVVRPGKQGS